jgi:hypothetical protein
MKNKLSLFLLFISISSFSQSMESLKTETKKLYQANYLLDFEAIEKLSYPGMVESMGRAAFLEKCEWHYENEQYRLRYQLESMPIPLGKIETVGSQSFCVITLRIPKRYSFEKKLTTEQASDKKIWLQEMNKTKEVIFEPNRNSFNVKATTTYVAVYDDTTNGEWKFFNLDNVEQLFVFNTLFDEKTKTALGL